MKGAHSRTSLHLTSGRFFAKVDLEAGSPIPLLYVCCSVFSDRVLEDRSLWQIPHLLHVAIFAWNRVLFSPDSESARV